MPFRVSCKGFLSGFLVRISKHSCGFLWGFFRVSFRVSFKVSLGFHVGSDYEVVAQAKLV